MWLGHAWSHSWQHTGEPQGQDQLQLPLIFQPVFTEMCLERGSRPHLRFAAKHSSTMPRPPPSAGAQLLVQRLPWSPLSCSFSAGGWCEGSTDSKVSGRLVHSPAQLSLDKHLARSYQICSYISPVSHPPAPPRNFLHNFYPYQ